MNDEEDLTFIPHDWEEHTPDWWKTILEKPERYFLVLTDDADAYYSCKLLKNLSDDRLKVGGFYDFHKGWFISDNVLTDYSLGIAEPVFVDCSAIHFKTFNNHSMELENPQEINFNNFPRMPLPYIHKFSGSTYAELMWLYGIDIATLPENEQCRILLIDSYYIGHFEQMFAKAHTAWLNDLGWSDTLLPLLNKYSRKAFKRCHDEHYNFKIQITDDGQLFSNDNSIVLPKETFHNVLKVEERKYDLDEFRCLPKDEREKAFNLSRTRKDVVKGSFVI